MPCFRLLACSLACGSVDMQQQTAIDSGYSTLRLPKGSGRNTDQEITTKGQLIYFAYHACVTLCSKRTWGGGGRQGRGGDTRGDELRKLTASREHLNKEFKKANKSSKPYWVRRWPCPRYACLGPTKGADSARQTRDTTTETCIAYGNSTWHASQYKVHKLHWTKAIEIRRVTHTHSLTHTHTSARTHKRTHTQARAHAHTNERAHAHTHTHKRAKTHAYSNTDTKDTHARSCTHNTHIHTHTRTDGRQKTAFSETLQKHCSGFGRKWNSNFRPFLLVEDENEKEAKREDLTTRYRILETGRFLRPSQRSPFCQSFASHSVFHTFFSFSHSFSASRALIGLRAAISTLIGLRAAVCDPVGLRDLKIWSILSGPWAEGKGQVFFCDVIDVWDGVWRWIFLPLALYQCPHTLWGKEILWGKENSTHIPYEVKKTVPTYPGVKKTVPTYPMG